MKHIHKIIINFIGLNIIITTLLTTLKDEFFELDTILEDINVEK